MTPAIAVTRSLQSGLEGADPLRRACEQLSGGLSEGLSGRYRDARQAVQLPEA